MQGDESRAAVRQSGGNTFDIDSSLCYPFFSSFARFKPNSISVGFLAQDQG